MLSTVHIVTSLRAEINGKTYYVAEWGVPLKTVLAMNIDKDVYIYKPSLYSPRVRGFVIKPNR